MEITVKIKEVQYGKLAVKFLPVIQEKMELPGNAVGKLVRVVTQLPENVILSVFDAISEEDKNEIVSLLVEDYQDLLLEKIAAALDQNDIAVKITKISLSKDMELRAVVDQIDYTSLVMRLIPLLKSASDSQENSSGVVLSGLLKLPGFLVKKALEGMSQKSKDEIVAYFVNTYKQTLLQKIAALVQKNGLELKLEDIAVHM